MSYKIGFVEWGFPFPGPYAMKIASELGLEGMELDFGEYEMDFPLHNPRIQDAYLECGEKFGIAFPSMALNALNTHGMSSGRDTLDGKIAIETIRKGIAAAKRMDIPVVQLPSFHDNRGDIRTDEDFYNTCEMLRFACDLAADSKIILAMENVLDAERTKQMIREVGSDRLKVLFDTQNYYLNHGYSQPQLLEDIAEYVVQIHVKDGFNNTISSALLGTGDVSFLETAEVIKRTGCTEWLLLENFYYQQPLSLLTDDTFELVAKDIATLRRIFDLDAA
ncbi:MAG: sugar phosphate isomerase/epimerase family protein [Eubacteriales bacterium]|nr:sugar phosphate isomerase/epimerase family protein [Eubacteriales bacterium]